jgi:heme/copper-type cytochrome/quinol oxidase subunit 1
VAAPSAPPRTVNIAFWLYVVGAVLSVISGIVTIATIGSTRDSALEQIRNSPQANGQNAQALVDGIIAAATIWAIVTLIFWAVVFVLFAFFMRRGANWARIVLTVLTALSLLNVLAGYGVGFLQFAATVVALVLIWLRPSSEYFAAVRASKAPRA